MFLGKKHSNLSGGGPFRLGMSWWGLVADLLGPDEDLLGYLKEREGYTRAGGLYSPSESLPQLLYPIPSHSGGSGGWWTFGYLLTLPVHCRKYFF